MVMADEGTPGQVGRRILFAPEACSVARISPYPAPPEEPPAAAIDAAGTTITSVVPVTLMDVGAVDAPFAPLVGQVPPTEPNCCKRMSAATSPVKVVPAGNATRNSS